MYLQNTMPTVSMITAEDAIKSSIVSLKEHTGSTMATIIKFVKEHWSYLQPQALRTVARRMVKEGSLIKAKRAYKIPKRMIRRNTLQPSKKSPPRKIITRLSKRKPRRKPSKYMQSDPELIVIKKRLQEDVNKAIKPKKQYRRRRVQRRVNIGRKNLRSNTFALHN